MKIPHRTFAAAFLFFLTTLSITAFAEDKAQAYKFGKEGIEPAKNKQWDKAINNFEKAVKADPQEANNHNNLGLAYKGAGKLDQALRAFTDALAVEPYASSALVQRR